mmetsp:Transcript_81286/g.217328  ORF Transcript_81286/g.217328 Transcript_81286/m.217328 type:complete len:80 (-) Transcript_81286:6-245(-)
MLFPRDDKLHPVPFDHTPEEQCVGDERPSWCSDDEHETFIRFATDFFMQHNSLKFVPPLDDPAEDSFVESVETGDKNEF